MFVVSPLPISPLPYSPLPPSLSLFLSPPLPLSLAPSHAPHSPYPSLPGAHRSDDDRCDLTLWRRDQNTHIVPQLLPSMFVGNTDTHSYSHVSLFVSWLSFLLSLFFIAREKYSMNYPCVNRKQGKGGWENTHNTQTTAQYLWWLYSALALAQPPPPPTHTQPARTHTSTTAIFEEKYTTHHYPTPPHPHSHGSYP